MTEFAPKVAKDFWRPLVGGFLGAGFLHGIFGKIHARDFWRIIKDFWYTIGDFWRIFVGVFGIHYLIPNYT